MRWLADAAYFLAALIYLPVLGYQAIFLGKNRTGWRQRLGDLPPFDRTKKRIWIHGVSLGEINCTPRLAELLQKRLPDYEIVFSTTTDTGYARAVRLYGIDRVFRFPLDFSPVISRVLRRVNPSLIVLVELEVWFNLIRSASRISIPVAVINGRLTERSARRFKMIGFMARSMFRHLAWVGAQDELIAERFRSAGVPTDRVETTSSLKWDTALVADRIDGADELAQAIGIDQHRPFWVCGSTGPGEEEMILTEYRRILAESSSLARVMPDHSENANERNAPILAIVPRKPERFEDVASLIEREGFDCVRRSRHADGTTHNPSDRPTVFLGDTMGELRKFYSLCDVAFIGRSLVPLGGSDPMEAAALGKAIVIGPYADNFKLPVETLRGADAVRIINSPAELSTAVGKLIQDRLAARAMGARARQVVVQNRGATEKTVDRLVALLRKPGYS